MLNPDQKSRRRIGGSTIAKIMRQSRWGTPLDAYLQLTGERELEEKSGEDIDRGNFLEPGLREWASKKIGQEFVQVPMMTHPDWDWATVNPDGIGVETSDLLEIKAPRRDDISQWGEEFSDQVPTDALLQTAWGCMVGNCRRGWIVALLGGSLKVFEYKRDREMEQKLLDAAKSFVSGFVLPRVPPPPAWGDDHNVLYMHPRNTTPHRVWSSLSEQERYVVGEYLSKYQFAKEAEKALEGWEPVIKNVIGDASGIDLPPEYGKRVDWKSNATAPVRWKGVAEALLKKLSKEEAEAVIAEFTPQTGARVLRPYFHTEKK